MHIMKGIQELQSDILSAIGGRTDVYAIQDASGGYHPEHSELNLKIYSDDNSTIGAYLVGLDGFVKTAIIDIDINKAALSGDREELNLLARKQTLQIQSVLEANGLISHIEDSGNKGYHLWLFFDAPVPARDLRSRLNELAKQFELIDPRLHWEIFPKQDTVAQGRLGNLIKLPFQYHKVSMRRCMFVDQNFEVCYPDELPINSAKLIPATSASSSISSTDLGSQKAKSIPPFNMEMMFRKCRVLSDMDGELDPKSLEGSFGHEKRLFLASQMKPFGEKGRARVHDILSRANDYDPDVTDYQLSSVSGPPQTCKIVCGEKKCANICKAGGNSPIKFGYQDEIMVFLEKQTSSFAYLDRRDDQVYFVDSEKKISIILADAGQSSEKIPVMKLIFDPQLDLSVDKDTKTVNLFNPTDFMVIPKDSSVVNPSADFPNILKLISNLVPDALERERLFNWLSGIMQDRRKQLTAWVFIGEQGAGKNVFLDHILKPLFGLKQAIKVEDEQLKSQFNGWLQNAILIAFNEVAHDNRTRNAINSKIKAIVTDDELSINEKNVKGYVIANHTNALFFSNNEIPVLIENGDRRFNVVRTGGNLRKNAWFSNPEQFFQDIKSELPAFAQYLKNYSYDAVLAKTVFSNSVKEALVDAGMNRFEEFATHLKANDVDWFVENDDSLFPAGNLKVVGLNGWIEKDVALKLFNSINPDGEVGKKKLFLELKLYGIRRGEINGKKVYRWD